MDKKLNEDWNRFFDSQNFNSDYLKKIILEFCYQLNNINYVLPDNYKLFNFSNGGECLRLVWNKIPLNILFSFGNNTDDLMIIVKTYDREYTYKNLIEVLELFVYKDLNYII